MAKKKYDPLWEVIGEKSALQGQEPDVDAHCPHCHVKVHLERSPKAGARVACGLCGGMSVIVIDEGRVILAPAESTQAST